MTCVRRWRCWKAMPGKLVQTDVEVDPMAELSGVYRHVGADGTVQRPTREGPAMVFNNVKGHPDARVATGLRMTKIKSFPIADMIPAMVLAMPFSWLWSSCIVPLLG